MRTHRSLLIFGICAETPGMLHPRSVCKSRASFLRCCSSQCGRRGSHCGPVMKSDTAMKYREVYHDFPLSRIVIGETVRLDNVLFVQSKSELLSESYAQLDMLLRFLNQNLKSKIELAGHTDNQGSAKLNLELSNDRVIVIRDHLISTGVSKKRISRNGYGATRPVASNSNPETRRLNRRVEFKLIE